METETKVMPVSLARELAAKYSLEPKRFTEVLRGTYFAVKDGPPLSDEEIAAALAICKRYDLDPFLREVHCTRHKDRLMIMVGIDGWLRAAQRDGKLVGIDAPEVVWDVKGGIEAVTVRLYHAGWQQPVAWTAYLREWRKQSPNWDNSPIHMLTIKALKLALRFGFGIGGGLDLEDPDDLDGAPTNGHTMAPGVRSSRPLEPVTPRPAAARPAGGTAAPKAQPAGGGGAAAVLAPREAAPPSDPSLRPGEDQAPWDVDDAEDAPPARQDGPGTAPEAANEPEAVAPPETPPAASQAAPSARETMIEAVRGLEGKLTAAGVVVHVSSREELEETSQAELQKRATQLRQSLWNAKKPGGKSKA